MNWKYITVDDGTMESGIIFPPWILHKRVVAGIGGAVLGAGFIEIVDGKVVCSGESDSLKVQSRGQADAELFHGMCKQSGESEVSFTEWLSSTDGQTCSDADTLIYCSNPDHYLQKRLRRAFIAGVDSTVRREVLQRTLSALESSVEDGINYGLSRVEPEYLAAISEAKAELEATTSDRVRKFTDTDRLNFLLQFIAVEDVGDEESCKGIVADSQRLEEAVGYGPMANGRMEGNVKEWNDDLRDVIDRAMVAHGFANDLLTDDDEQPEPTKRKD